MKKNILKKFIFIMLSFLLLTILIGNFCMATSFDPGAYNPGTVRRRDAEPVFAMGEKIFGALRNIAALIAVVTIGIIGLRYMFGSVDSKAEYKATMMPWVIGVLMVVLVTTLLDVIQNLASKI